MQITNYTVSETKKRSNEIATTCPENVKITIHIQYLSLLDSVQDKEQKGNCCWKKNFTIKLLITW